MYFDSQSSLEEASTTIQDKLPAVTARRNRQPLSKYSTSSMPHITEAWQTEGKIPGPEVKVTGPDVKVTEVVEWDAKEATGSKGRGKKSAKQKRPRSTEQEKAVVSFPGKEGGEEEASCAAAGDDNPELSCSGQMDIEDSDHHPTPTTTTATTALADDDVDDDDNNDDDDDDVTTRTAAMRTIEQTATTTRKVSTTSQELTATKGMESSATTSVVDKGWGSGVAEGESRALAKSSSVDEEQGTGAARRGEGGGMTGLSQGGQQPGEEARKVSCPGPSTKEGRRGVGGGEGAGAGGGGGRGGQVVITETTAALTYGQPPPVSSSSSSSAGAELGWDVQHTSWFHRFSKPAVYRERRPVPAQSRLESEMSKVSKELLLSGLDASFLDSSASLPGSSIRLDTYSERYIFPTPNNSPINSASNKGGAQGLANNDSNEDDP